MKLIKIISFFFAMLATTGTYAVSIGGVEFPDGEVSFADAVVSYSPGSDVGSPNNDPTSALGIPDWDSQVGATSLGNDGELILQFTDNSLTTSSDESADVWIFEVGDAVESFNVAISTDNSTWIDIGDVSGQPTGIDIDSVMGVIPGTLYSFVRLRDVSPEQSGFPVGEADIDAVGAISSAQPVPLPAAIWLFGSGLIGLFWIRK